MGRLGGEGRAAVPRGEAWWWQNFSAGSARGADSTSRDYRWHGGRSSRASKRDFFWKGSDVQEQDHVWLLPDTTRPIRSLASLLILAIFLSWTGGLDSRSRDGEGRRLVHLSSLCRLQWIDAGTPGRAPRTRPPSRTRQNFGACSPSKTVGRGRPTPSLHSTGLDDVRGLEFLP